MNIKKLIGCFICLMMTWSSTYSQNNHLQLADTISEEGSLRYFKLSSDIAEKGISESASILKAALKTDTDTEFRLVKTKKGQNLEKHLLYQQYYKAVPIYDGYYYLHFKNDIFTYANGEYSSIKMPGNTIKLSKTTALTIAINNSVTKNANQPSSTKSLLILWRQGRSDEYKYVYKVEVNYPDALQSRISMIDAATGKVHISVPLVCSINVPCTGATVYSGNRNFTGGTFSAV